MAIDYSVMTLTHVRMASGLGRRLAAEFIVSSVMTSGMSSSVNRPSLFLRLAGASDQWLSI
jgi:hypothetical protein